MCTRPKQVQSWLNYMAQRRKNWIQSGLLGTKIQERRFIMCPALQVAAVSERLEKLVETLGLFLVIKTNWPPRTSTIIQDITVCNANVIATPVNTD